VPLKSNCKETVHSKVKAREGVASRVHAKFHRSPSVGCTHPCAGSGDPRRGAGMGLARLLGGSAATIGPLPGQAVLPC